MTSASARFQNCELLFDITRFFSIDSIGEVCSKYLHVTGFRMILPRKIITQTCLCNILQFFTVVKKGNFQMKKKKSNIFLIVAQNVDCGYTLEPPQ